MQGGLVSLEFWQIGSYLLASREGGLLAVIRWLEGRQAGSAWQAGRVRQMQAVTGRQACRHNQAQSQAAHEDIRV
jgi:hypothetical protein